MSPVSPITAARQLQKRIVAAIGAMPALAGADIRSNAHKPLPTTERLGVRCMLESTRRSRPPRLGAATAEWMTYLQFDCLARAEKPGDDAADAVDPVLLAVFEAVQTLGGPDITAVSLLEDTAAEWLFEDADTAVAKVTLHAQIRHIAAAESLMPITTA